MASEIYLLALREEIDDWTSRSPDDLPNDLFTRVMVDKLVQSGELTPSQVCFFESAGLSVSAFGLDEETGRLDLVASIYNNSESICPVTKDDYDRQLRSLENFAKIALQRKLPMEDEASPQADMADAIASARPTLRTLNLFVITDGRIPPEVTRTRSNRIEGIAGQIRVWDLDRFERLQSLGMHEPIHVDVQAFLGEPLRALQMPRKEHVDYDCYVAIVPGSFLADIYDRWGPRLLERNVRSFLQAKGTINDGIQQTIKGEPSMFLAYNNGISATASAVATNGRDGSLAITHINDLQIVNGGQTTASLHWARNRKGSDLRDIYVQIKLSAISQTDMSEVVTSISKYANSQNKISWTDLSANDEFHIHLERLSRSIQSPGPSGTFWFYERARGQYADEALRQGSPAKAKSWRKTHPPAQKLEKTDVSRAALLWSAQPHIVSLGAQKAYGKWEENRDKNLVPTDQFFHGFIAQTIIVSHAEHLVSKIEAIRGYRANVVAYTIAWLALNHAEIFQIEAVWRDQKTSIELDRAIESVALQVYELLIETAAGANVSELAKKPAFWERVIDAEFVMGELDASREKRELRDKIVELLKGSDEPLPRRLIGEAIDADGPIVQRVLKALLDEKIVVMKGEKRGARYALRSRR